MERSQLVWRGLRHVGFVIGRRVFTLGPRLGRRPGGHRRHEREGLGHAIGSVDPPDVLLETRQGREGAEEQVTGADLEQVKEYLAAEAHTTEVEWEQVTPWAVTPWKILPRGHRARIRREASDAEAGSYVDLQLRTSCGPAAKKQKV